MKKQLWAQVLIESMGKQNESLRECKTSQNSADIVKLHMGGEHLSFMEAEEGDSSKSSQRPSIYGGSYQSNLGVDMGLVFYLQ